MIKAAWGKQLDPMLSEGFASCDFTRGNGDQLAQIIALRDEGDGDHVFDAFPGQLDGIKHWSIRRQKEKRHLALASV